VSSIGENTGSPAYVTSMSSAFPAPRWISALRGIEAINAASHASSVPGMLERT
jgi:hypothetical protein